MDRRERKVLKVNLDHQGNVVERVIRVTKEIRVYQDLMHPVH